jgi:hypothetical protein
MTAWRFPEESMDGRAFTVFGLGLFLLKSGSISRNIKKSFLEQVEISTTGRVCTQFVEQP